MKKLIYFGILITALTASCKKDLRTEIYNLRPYNNSGLSGKISFIETKDKDTIQVKLEAQGLAHDTVYLTHLHTGTPGNLTGTLIYFDNLQTPSGNVVRTATWAKSFEDAINSNTCFTMHTPAFFSNDTIGYVLAGNTGANAH